MERIGYTRPDAPAARLTGPGRNTRRGSLGHRFDLDFTEAVCSWIGESGEAVRDWVAYFERHRTGAAVSAPRPYLVVLGGRKRSAVPR